MDAKYGPRNQRYDMRKQKPRDYSHLFATEGKEEKEEEDTPAADEHKKGESEEGDAPLATP